MADEEKPVEVGSFRVARERMLEILKQYQLPDPLQFGKSVLRAASAGGAARFQLRQIQEDVGFFGFERGARGVEFAFDGSPLSPAELKDPFAPLVQDEELGATRGRWLAFGIVNALRLEPASMTLTSGTGAGRVEVSIHNDLSLKSSPSPGPETDTVLRLRWQSLPEWLHFGGPGRLLGPVAPVCRFPVRVDGKAVAYLPEVSGWQYREFEQGPVRGVLRRPMDLAKPPQLQMFINGVFAANEPFAHSRVPVEGYMNDDRLRLNLSQTALVRDEFLETALRRVEQEAEAFLCVEAAAQNQSMSRIAAELYEPEMRKVWNEALGGADAWMVVTRSDILSRAGRFLAGLLEPRDAAWPISRKRQLAADAARTAWLRDACVRLLGDFDKDSADPLLARLWACELLAATDGSAVKLEELFTVMRRHGRIPATRRPGGPGEERRVWLACPEDGLFLSRMAEKERWTFSE